MRYLRFPEGKDRAVTLSYDDGCRSDIRFSREIGRYGLRATFNLNSGLIAEQPGEWRLTEEEIREYLLRPGYEIAVHGEYHRSTGALRPLEGIREVLGCRLSLEQRFGGLVRGMAYPNAGITQLSEGVTYPEIRQYLRELGIVYARTLGGDNDRFELPNDWLAWMPTAHQENPRLFDWIRTFREGGALSGPPRLFFLWGHSFELEKNGGWARLDRIGEQLGGCEDTWYATNMEIYTYVTAYRELVFSADGHTVYNPSLQPVWLWEDGSIYTVAAGETRRLP